MSLADPVLLAVGLLVAAVLASSALMRSACLRPVPGGTIRTAPVLSGPVS